MSLREEEADEWETRRSTLESIRWEVIRWFDHTHFNATRPSSRDERAKAEGCFATR
jgi:hypothetical protein